MLLHPGVPGGITFFPPILGHPPISFEPDMALVVKTVTVGLGLEELGWQQAYGP